MGVYLFAREEKQLYLYLGYCIRRVRFIFRALLSVIYFVLNMGWRNYIFELPKESENSIHAFVKTILFPMLFSHSLSFRLVRNHSKLTIFNSFNSIAHEFFVESFHMEIFRVFEDLATSCLTTNCKHIEDRLKKDGVLMVRKRRLFPKKRRVSGAKTSFFDPKDFVFFRKNAVFFSRMSFLPSEKCDFDRKQAQNSMKILSTSLFRFLDSLFGK